MLQRIVTHDYFTVFSLRYVVVWLHPSGLCSVSSSEQRRRHILRPSDFVFIMSQSDGPISAPCFWTTPEEMTLLSFQCGKQGNTFVFFSFPSASPPAFSGSSFRMNNSAFGAAYGRAFCILGTPFPSSALQLTCKI